jgi:hypothetical protein
MSSGIACSDVRLADARVQGTARLAAHASSSGHINIQVERGGAGRVRLDSDSPQGYPVKVTTFPANNWPPGCGGRGPQDRSWLAQQFTELDQTS